MQQVFLPAVPPEALLTLVCLATHEEDGVTWISAAKIAQERSLRRQVVYRHLESLRKAGYITAIDPTELPESKVRAYSRNTTKAPRIWRLNYGDFATGVSQDVTGAVSQDVTPDGPQHVTADVSLHVNAIEEVVEVGMEGEASAMPSEAQADLGGSTYDPTPEEILGRRYPSQCAKHQSRKNADPHFEPCGGCQRAAKELPEVQARMRRHRRDQEIQAQREEAQREAQAIAACSMCDKRGRLPNGGLCLHDPDAAEASHRGYLRALEAVRNAARSAA